MTLMYPGARPLAPNTAGGRTGGRPQGFAPAPAAPAPAPASAPVDPTFAAIGGGGGGVAAAAPATAARPNLEDYIRNNFLYTQQDNQNKMNLDQYDAQTMLQQQQGQANGDLRQQQLQQNLNDQGQANAESFAARGLGRSGGVFAMQDKINANGQVQRQGIQQALQDLIANRGQGRLTQQQANQQALDSKIQQITQQFNSSQTLA